MADPEPIEDTLALFSRRFDLERGDGDDVVRTAIPPVVDRWLQVHDAVARDTLSSFGVPAAFGQYRAAGELGVTTAFEGCVPRGGDQRLGEACLVMTDVLPKIAPARGALVISESGSFIETLVGVDGRVDGYRLNTGYSQFVVFCAALASVQFGDERGAFALLPELAVLDRWAFESPSSRWPTLLAEGIYGDLFSTAREEDLIRSVALGVEEW